MINSISIALSGLTAASKKAEATASNVANLTTTGSLEAGGQAPYTPLETTQQATNINNGEATGVRSNIIQRSTQPFVPSYDPDSPFANAEGLIGVPNIDLATEVVNLNVAELTYKANIEVIKTSEEMFDALLDAFDEKA